MKRIVYVYGAVLAATLVYCVIVQVRLGDEMGDALVGYLGAILIAGGTSAVIYLSRQTLRELEEKNLELEEWIERRTADLHAAREATEAAAREKVAKKKQGLSQPEGPAEEAPPSPPVGEQEPETEAQPEASESWSWTKERTVPSKGEAGQIVVEEILQVLDDLKWPRHQVFGVHLAMGEAITNAIKHGNRSEPDKQVQVESKISERLLRVQVTDQGTGFDPASLPDPTAPENLEAVTGRGIMVMRNYMDRVDFSETGNRVTLEVSRGEDDADE